MSLKDQTKRLKAKFEIGEKRQEALIQSIASMVIRDRLVPPKAMKFLIQFVEQPHDPNSDAVVVPTGIGIRYGDDPKLVKIHRHALGQLAGKVKFPIAYLNELSRGDLWRYELLIHNLNTLFHSTDFPGGTSSRFLHRLVGDELRGFLSRRFNRHLASLPLLRAFVDSVKESGGQPVETTTTDLRWSLKCYLPNVFEAFPGQYIAVGVTQSHSDFGAGKHVISQTIWDPARDTRTVLEGVSKVHLGSVIEESDIEMSDETAKKEVEAQCSAARDAVQKYLSEEFINKSLAAVKSAHEQQIPWSQLKSRLSDILYEKELNAVEAAIGNPSIIDLPPIGTNTRGEPLPTKWWAASVISALATNQDDERKLELQHLAGKWIGS